MTIHVKHLSTICVWMSLLKIIGDTLHFHTVLLILESKCLKCVQKALKNIQKVHMCIFVSRGVTVLYVCVTGMIDLREDNVESLLSTACLLQLSEVKDACCSFLVKQLHPSNCIGIRQFADAQGCNYLYTVANNYVMVSGWKIAWLVTNVSVCIVNNYGMVNY